MWLTSLFGIISEVDPRVAKGATEAAIELLPYTTIEEGTEGVDGSCPICLNDMVIGEEARVLTCKHMFHRQCLDEWLRVNASCPTCRTSIFESTSSDDAAASSPMHEAETPSGDSNNSNNRHQHMMLPTSELD